MSVLTRPETRACARALAPFRRRLSWSAFTRRVPVVCALGLGALDLVLLIVGLDARAIAMSCAAIVVVAAVGTYAYSFLRMPSLFATAGLVDAHFELENRAVTALQFSDPSDPIARLIVTDATARLGAIEPSRLPLDVSAPRVWTAVLLLIAAVLAGVVPAREGSRLKLGSDSSDVVDSGASRRTGAREQTQASRARAGGDGPHTSARSPESPIASDQQMPARDDRRASDASRGNTSRAGSEQNSRSDQSRPAITSSAEQNRAAGDQVAAETRTARDGHATSAGRSSGRGGRGGIATASDGVAAGGVGDGRLPPFASPAAAQRSIVAVDSDTYRRAMQQTETAIARDRVPARFRSYVRDYFTAIRPEPRP